MVRGHPILTVAVLGLIAGPVYAADKPEMFAPPVGSSLDVRTTTTYKFGSQPEASVQSEVHREVLENDGLTAKYSNKIVSQTAAGSAVPSQMVESPDNYTVYRSYLPVEISSVSKPPSSGDTVRFHQLFECDKSVIQSFLPLGRIPSVEVPCKFILETSGQSQPPRQLGFQISFEGSSTTTTPAGSFTVANIRVVQQNGETRTDTLYLIDTSRGMTVSSHTVTTAPDRRTELNSQLVRYKLAGG